MLSARIQRQQIRADFKPDFDVRAKSDIDLLFWPGAIFDLARGHKVSYGVGGKETISDKGLAWRVAATSGANAYVDTAIVGSRAFTYLAVVKFNSLTGTTFSGVSGNDTGAVICSQRELSTDVSATFCVSNVSTSGSTVMGLWLGIDGSGTARGRKGGTTITTGRWYALAGTFDPAEGFPGGFHVYVDGQLDDAATANIGTTTSFSGSRTRFGGNNQWPTAANDDADVEIAYVARIPRALNAAEIAEWHRHPFGYVVEPEQSRTIVLLQAGGITLTADDATSTPAADTAALSQAHALTGSDAAGAGALDTGAASQIHALASADAATTPSADSAPLTQQHGLTGADATATPSADTGAIGQTHALGAADATATGLLDTAAASQQHALTGTDAAATPETAAAAIAQVHALVGSDATSTGSLDTGALGTEGTHTLTGTDAAATGSLDTGAIGQIHALTGADATGTPSTETGAASQIHGLSGDDAAATGGTDAAPLAQIHALAGADATAVGQLDSGAAGQTHNLVGADAVSTGALDTGALEAGPAHDLIAADAVATPAADAVAISQIHALAASDAIGSPSAEAKSVTQIHALAGTDATSTGELTTGKLSDPLPDARRTTMRSLTPRLSMRRITPKLTMKAA
jgi:hypothetical protein